MKSESQLRPFVATGPAGDAFQAFFDMVDAPAALCDLSLQVLTANSPFEVLCGQKNLVGRPLAECLGTAPMTAPEEGKPVDVDVVLKTGQHVTLTASRRGQTVALVARRLSPMLDSLAAAGRALLEQARVESQLLEIGRNVAGATGEEELVATVARGVKGLFPGRTFVVRIVDPRTCALTSLYAEGRLRDGARDVFHLRRSMVEKTHLDTSHLPPDKVVVTTTELPLVFTGSVRGIAAPLVASGQLVGAINIEYPAGLSADVVADERILIQLANQVSVAVRNAKLIDELTFVRKYLEELLENANALIVVTNREGRVVVFNKALTQLTGLSKAEALGRDFEELVAPAMKLSVMRLFNDALSGAQSAFETTLLTREGREARVTLASSAVMSQSGDIEGVIAIGQDLSRMRDLERRVVQAEKLASLGQLAASVMHEINNPMTAVATYADALLSRASTSLTADPADVSKYRKIVENTDRVLRFTRDLVSYARPAQETPDEVDLNATIERAIGFCDHVLQKHGVTLERHFGEVPPLLAVRQNLVQVFVNLITNACHATPAGGRIDLRTRLDDDGQVRIEIADTGAGIAPDVQLRIFEPFFTTKPDGKGTGLGLSIVQGIIENHGGRITVESAPGQGSRFTISLPVVKPA